MGKKGQKRQKFSKKGGKSYEALGDNDTAEPDVGRRKNGRNGKGAAAAAAAAAGGAGGRRKKNKGGKNGVRQYDDASFRHALEGDGSKTIHDMAADGNCLFRSISDQLYQDWGNRHDQVRMDICSFLEDNEEEFGVFLLLDEDEKEDVCDFKEYCKRMREDGEWGGNVELVSAARLYQRNIMIFSAKGAWSIESGNDQTSGDDLLISFHDNHHYNSVRDNNDRENKAPTGVYKSPSSKKSAEQSKYDNPKKANNQNGQSSRKDDEQKTDVPVKKKKGESSSGHQQRRNDLCSCGSGLRYKKCCLATEKSQKRMAKWKEKNGIESVHIAMDSKVEENEETMVGNFKVLKI